MELRIKVTAQELAEIQHRFQDYYINGIYDEFTFLLEGVPVTFYIE